MLIKQGDTVAIIAGKDQFITDKKGVKTRRSGVVLKVLPTENRVIVEGVNVIKKHQRPTQGNDKGGIFEQPAPIHISNVALIDPESNLPTRVRLETVEEKGKTRKVRVATKSGARLDK